MISVDIDKADIAALRRLHAACMKHLTPEMGVDQSEMDLLWEIIVVLGEEVRDEQSHL